jgi:flavin reductase (DIM6/NTAB) family NADH-FMN oxidoreductase RutF
MRKLWNRPDLPVWSLVTAGQEGQTNMNICTYVTSVSMTPKLMMIAVYEHTKTLENILAQPKQPILLQLLSQSLAPVVRICGQQSGHTIDKVNRLRKKYSLSYYEELPYFVDAAGIMQLVPDSLITGEGDHCLVVAKVAWSKNLNDVPILTTEYLKRHKFTR